MHETLAAAFQNVFSIHVLLVIFATAAFGLFVGAIPGLTATMAVALLVPFTFFMDDLSALAAVATLSACAIFAGDIPGALLRIPGTPSSAAYANDAYAMTRAGRSADALMTSLVFSVLGGLLGAAALIAAAPQLAKLSFQFTTYEYFWLVVLGLSCAAVVAHGSRLKGTLSLVIGLFFSTVGLSEVHSTPRFTFGRDELITGVNFIPAMIGLFGLSEVLRNALWLGAGSADLVASDRFAPAPSYPGAAWSALRLAWERKLHLVRSAAVGAIIGILPGAGADIAAWISYGISKRFAKAPERFGTGSTEGLADATGANNASLASAWVPALVFGIPGDSVTAIVIGVLLMKNITPGPQIFTDAKQAVLVHGLYLAFIVANLVLLPLGYLAIRVGTLLVRAPRHLLLPAIVLVCIVGTYAIGGSYFDVGVMLGMGVLGFVLESFTVPLGPLVLGIVLGGQLEHTFLQNLIKSDGPVDFVRRPISLLLFLACLGLWLSPWLLRRRAGSTN